VPAPIKDAVVDAVRADANGYTLTQGAPPLLEALGVALHDEFGWTVPDDDYGLMVTSGTSGALLLAFMALLNPGDEVIVGDPWFVIYPALAELCGATMVACDTYPDFRLTAERVAPLITERTKAVLVNSPGNPSGVVLDGAEVEALRVLCRDRGVVLISDEIYDQFTYADAREDGRCPSPARGGREVLLIRGFGKTYGCTGWRLGYAVGPKALIQQMAKLQQYTFVCAPSMAQHGAIAALQVDMSEQIEAYRRRRDLVVETLGAVAQVTHPGGAFYAFVEVPPALRCTATELVEQAIEHRVLTIPGAVFSGRDTHFRLSYAVPEDTLREGLDVLRALCLGAPVGPTA
jgi:aspartate/methionine/tyrosine aminotransferase